MAAGNTPTPGLNGYYTSQYSGEEIDELLGKISSGISADDVSYDSSASGLTANTVQQALDALTASKADVNRVSNPSLLINGYLADPINLKGETFYSDAGYTIDMWHKHAGTTLSIQNGFVRWQVNTASFQVLIQVLEDTQLIGKEGTASYLVRTNNKNAFRFLIKKDSADLCQVENEWTLVHVTRVIQGEVFSISDGHPYVAIQVSADAQPNDYIDIKAIKLELGPVQTLAHQEGNVWVLNDPPPNKALELAKCQWYFQRTISRGAYDNIAFGIIDSNNRAKIILSLPSTMRANPAISFSGAFKLVEANSNPFVSHPVTSMALSTLHDGSCTLNVTTSDTDCVVGTHCFLMGAEVGAHIDRDANL